MAKKAASKKKVSKVSKPAAGAEGGAEGAPAGGGRSGGGRSGGRRGGGGPGRGLGYKAGDATGKDLVIVESPSKAKTINKYLGSKYVVLASVGHVRDLPSKNPKGDKSPVPGVKIEKRFSPTYEVLEGKENVIKELKRAAKDATGSGGTVWFATDLDREGEAIAWHLAQELGIASADAKRVIFPAITKAEIEKAFSKPHPIDEDRVNAQQARRILDRIVGYQVSPLLWKKVARGLSAGRVQSVAVRLIVEREREIRSFVPDEYWEVGGCFALSEAEARKLGPAWRAFLAQKDEKGAVPTGKAQTAWLSEAGAIRAELVEFDGEKFDPRVLSAGRSFDSAGAHDLVPSLVKVAQACRLTGVQTGVREDAQGRGPARWVRTIVGVADPATAWTIESIETKRTSTRAAPPFITSTLQQAGSSRLGFAAQRTMRAAQSLYEGVNIPGEGPVGLITYMRTDSTHLSGEAIGMARGYIERTFGKKYLPEGPNFFRSSNKAAQEAHEAIRPTDVTRTPESLKSALKPDEFRLYQVIWQRFVACQMVAAEWDSTAVLIRGGQASKAVFRATGRTLVFDGHYRVSGVPGGGEELTLPKLSEKQRMSAFDVSVEQKFTSPPARYTEAGLIKTLEAEGIGRPSTYAAIIQTIQDRKYVEQVARAFHSTDLGEVVTDKLIEAFPEIMDVGYTREMEAKLDQVEEDHLDWVEMLERFYGPFKENLARAEEELSHAKAEVTPAPKEYRCAKCASDLVYRFGKNGRFLSCSTYPACDYACPVDRMGRPQLAEFVDVRCPKSGRVMVRRTGRFGPFIVTYLEKGEDQDLGMILNIDKKGHVVAPSPRPLVTELACPTCQSPLNLRSGLRGPWLGCSRFPKCRGRGKWAELPEAQQKRLEAELAGMEKANPTPIICRLDGTPLTGKDGKPLKDAPAVDGLVLDHDPRETAGVVAARA